MRYRHTRVILAGDCAFGVNEDAIAVHIRPPYGKPHILHHAPQADGRETPEIAAVVINVPVYRKSRWV
jgi:hypothetical protein